MATGYAVVALPEDIVDLDIFKLDFLTLATSLGGLQLFSKVDETGQQTSGDDYRRWVSSVHQGIRTYSQQR
eukprot:65943-Chlamydomonas_euryale.AAC.1